MQRLEELHEKGNDPQALANYLFERFTQFDVDEPGAMEVADLALQALIKLSGFVANLSERVRELEAR